jgi:hypothetical protein
VIEVGCVLGLCLSYFPLLLSKTMGDGNGNYLGGFPLSEGEKRGLQIADETI